MMDIKKFSASLNRRSVLKALGLGTASGILGIAGGIPSVQAAGIEKASYNRGLPALKIKSVKAIGTAPQGANLV
ncbi:MAG TPA: twin-arginine translocation signal domain-containing protein, partial [Puia sp.]|nr:twin-arginine translocation signal domain-containing protein [Puia sp.]